MSKALIEKTIEGLTATALEKVCVLGREEAGEDIEKLRQVVVELVSFWDMDERYIEQFDMEVNL